MGHHYPHSNDTRVFSACHFENDIHGTSKRIPTTRPQPAHKVSTSGPHVVHMARAPARSHTSPQMQRCPHPPFLWRDTGTAASLVLALASLKPRFLLINDVYLAAPPHNLGARLVLQRPKGLTNLHGALLSLPMLPARPVARLCPPQRTWNWFILTGTLHRFPFVPQPAVLATRMVMGWAELPSAVPPSALG